jgi:hypothetical protein
MLQVQDLSILAGAVGKGAELIAATPNKHGLPVLIFNFCSMQ